MHATLTEQNFYAAAHLQWSHVGYKQLQAESTYNFAIEFEFNVEIFSFYEYF